MELDEATGRLQVGSTSHVLDHGCYGVLEALLAQSGVVVGKDALLRAGWPGRVVSENSLTKAIGRLRHLLEDPEGKLLCTAHGYGYRLATRAEWHGAEAAPPPAAAAAEALAPAPAALRREAPRPLVGFVLVLLLATLASLSWLAWQRSFPAATQLAAARPGTTAAVGEGASIAVLPFVDLSQRHDQRYFSEGLTDELLDRLSKLPQLRVASRTSSFTFRDSEEDIREIGRKLGVATVLEGSVRRDGDHLRITVQLINVASGFHLWSETYDKQMTDLFDVQDDIARSVVAALRLQLLPAQDLAVTRHRTSSMAAYKEFLLGEKYRGYGDSDNDRRAIAAYERAIAIDPEFSTAYASLANLLGGDAGYADSPAEVRAGKLRSIELMDKAIALEPDRAELYLARADFLYSTRHDWHAAQRDLDTAARMYRRRPPELLMRQSRLLAVLGRLDEAIAADRAGVQASPASVSALGMLGYHLAATGRYADAHRALAIAERLRPEDDHVWFYEGLTLLLEGKPAEASAAFERSGSVFRVTGLAAAKFDAHDEAASQEALRTLVNRYSPTGAYQVAQVHAWRGEADQAFLWLERAHAQQDAGVMYLRFDPMMRRLRADPRYRAWLAKLHLDDASLAEMH